MTPVVAVAGIVFDDQGRVLLIQRGKPPGQGLWTVPGGKLEGGESLADAVVREVREETGLDVTVGPLVEVVERIAEGYHYVILDYLAFGAGEPRAGTDAADARFVTREELAALPLTDGLLPVLDRARDVLHTGRGAPADRPPERSPR